MKNIVAVLLALILALGLAGCEFSAGSGQDKGLSVSFPSGGSFAASSSSTAPSASSPPSSSEAASVVSPELQALNLVKKYIAGDDDSVFEPLSPDGLTYKFRNSSYMIQYDSKLDNENHMIREFEYVIDNHTTGEGHTATSNWYEVDILTGEVVPMFEPATPLTFLGDTSLIGKWAARPDYTMDYSGGIEFRADGTFFRTENSYAQVRGELTQNGSYKIHGNQIICTNVTESWTEQGGYQGRNYTDKPINELTWSYYFASSTGIDTLDKSYPETTWLVINLSSDAPNLESWFAISTVE